MPDKSSSGRTCVSACQEPRLQSWWLPLASPSHSVHGAAHPIPAAQQHNNLCPTTLLPLQPRAGRARGGSWLWGPGAAMHLLPRKGLPTSQGIKLQHVNSLSLACSAGPALHVGKTLKIVCCNKAQLEQCLLVLVFLLWCNSEGYWGAGAGGE